MIKKIIKEKNLNIYNKYFKKLNKKNNFSIDKKNYEKSEIRDFKKKIDFNKKIQIILIIVCLFLFLLYAFYLFKPKIISFDYNDECGLMPGGNSLTHTIVSEDMCNNACYSYCISYEKKLLKSYFKEQQNKCNLCKCYCY